MLVSITCQVNRFELNQIKKINFNQVFPSLTGSQDNMSFSPIHTASILFFIETRVHVT